MSEPILTFYCWQEAIEKFLDAIEEIDDVDELFHDADLHEPANAN